MVHMVQRSAVEANKGACMRARRTTGSRTEARTPARARWRACVCAYVYARAHTHTDTHTHQGVECGRVAFFRVVLQLAQRCKGLSLTHSPSLPPSLPPSLSRSLSFSLSLSLALTRSLSHSLTHSLLAHSLTLHLSFFLFLPRSLSFTSQAALRRPALHRHAAQGSPLPGRCLGEPREQGCSLNDPATRV